MTRTEREARDKLYAQGYRCKVQHTIVGAKYYAIFDPVDHRVTIGGYRPSTPNQAWLGVIISG